MLIACLRRYGVINYTNIIVGDFNLPKICWRDFVCSSDYISTSFRDFVVTGGYTQLVNFDTREDSILDLVLTNDSKIVSSVSPRPPVGHSDHTAIDFRLDVRLVHDPDKNNDNAKNIGNEEDRYIYYWHRTDFDGLQQSMSQINWDNFFCLNPDVSYVWSAFLNVLWEFVREFVPHNNNNCVNTDTGMRGSRKRYPPHIHKLVIKKRHLWKELQNGKTDFNRRCKYRDCTNELRQKTRLLVRQREINIIQANNIGTFYKYVNSRIGYRQAIGTLLDANGNSIVSDQDKAEMFNKYFASMGTNDNGYLPTCDRPTLGSTLESITFTEADIIAAIRKLKPNLSAGPDRLPPLLFKKLAHSLSWPLCLIFTQLLSVGYIPDDWTKAIIIPVYKKGVSGDVTNYRPISLTCVACKLMERVIAKHVYTHLADNNLLSQAQHGFVRGHSTCTNLLECMNDWTLSVQDRKSVVVAYIDFSRAFDSVPHNKLLSKLHAYGIRGDVLRWLELYFGKRTHQTRVGTCLSDEVDLMSGVVQGSGIGPVTFLIYVDDLAKLLERYGIVIRLFADDVKVYLEIVNSNDASKLQCALDLITWWADEWQLSVSVSKCNILTIGKSQDNRKYYINGNELPHPTQCRDLGITITSDLSPSNHIQQITAKAHQRANSILRCFVSGNISLLVRAFIVYVRPLLEYNSVVWSPHLKQDIIRIEKVQRRFTKRLRGLRNLSYTDRLITVGLPSLELRRLQIDLIYCYKIVFGLVKVNLDDFFEFAPVKTTRGHAYKLYKPRCSNVRTNFFSNRVVEMWNSLPDCVSFESLSAFKRTISTIDLTGFLKCA